MTKFSYFELLQSLPLYDMIIPWRKPTTRKGGYALQTEEVMKEETAAEEASAEEPNTPPEPQGKRERISWRRPLAFLLAVSTVIVGGRLYSLRVGKDDPPSGEGSREEFLYGQVVDTSDAQYTYEEMEEDLRLLAQAYPSLLRVSSAGKTADGREIYYADFGSANAEKQIFVSAGIHGREYLTPLLAMKMLEYHLVNYDVRGEDGNTPGESLGDLMIRIVPMANPDGIAISQKGIDGLRNEALRQTVREIYRSDCEKYESYLIYGSLEEYLKYWKANARGVDINRNFPIAAWNYPQSGVQQPSSQAYRGNAPASEAETRALISLAEGLSNPMCVLSLHSQGEILYWDSGQTGEVREKSLCLLGVVKELTGYRSQATFTRPDATLDDWCILEKGIPAITLETGTGGCPLPIEQFETIWAQTKDLWQRVAKELS